MIDTPYFSLAPREPAANIQWRIKLRRAALHDLEVRKAVKQACLDDPLFFFMACAWLIEPRGKHKKMPFCLWDVQIPAILVLVESVIDGSLDLDNAIDVIFDKSRTMGATWMCLYVLLWFWLKDPLHKGGIISRTLEAVEKRKDLGTLMPKLDWAIGMLPFWLRPEGFNAKRDRSQVDHTWHNCELDGVLAGTACTPEAFSGDRQSELFCDEAAKFDHENFDAFLTSTQSVTNVRWFVSSHYGDSGPFHDMVFGERWEPSGKIFPLGGSGVYRNSTGGIKVILDWKDHPTHGRLAYRFVNGQAVAVDPAEAAAVAKYIAANSANIEKLRRKRFIKEGRIRSPWLDHKCLQKGATPQGIAQDIERDPRATVGKMFPPEILDDMAKHCRPPLWQGDVIVRDGNLHFIEQDHGPLKFWVPFTLEEGFPKGRYCFAIDPGTGIESISTGNSTICGADAATGEQMLEWNKQLSETRLADLAVALATWAWDALLIWEAQGPCGKRFAIRVMDELGYWNVWKRPAVKKPPGYHNPDQYGWNNNKFADKKDLFEDLYCAMDDEEFIPRSEELIAECRGWEVEEDEKTKNPKAVYHGPTGHGDRAIAGGMCNKAMKELGEKSLDKGRVSAQDDDDEWTIAGRMARRKAAEESGKNDIFAGFRRGRGVYR